MMKRYGISGVYTTLVLLAATALSGCSSLPASGPDPESIRHETGAALPYVMIPLTNANIDVLSQVRTVSFTSSFPDHRGAPTVTLGVGDVVTATVFEASAGGLFTPTVAAGARPGNNVDMPPLQIDAKGFITVPYAGNIRAAGRTIPEVQAEIEDKLKNRAIEPKVIIGLKEQHSAVISVMGEVGAPGVIAIPGGGSRVLEAIARAGGAKYPAMETYVNLQRGGKQVRVLLAKIVDDPRENISMRAGDVVYLVRDTPTFSAIGATGGTTTATGGLYPFDNETLTLAQALGKAGGLQDAQADPASVFVYRLEEPEVLKHMGVDYSTAMRSVRLVPTVYSIDLRDPSGMLMAQSFRMHDKDALFIGNAKSIEYLKFMNVINATTTTVGNGNSTVRQVGVKWGG